MKSYRITDISGWQ